jgi:hypothetical protein
MTTTTGRPCFCGCDEGTPAVANSRYLTGHDAKAAKKVKEFAVEHDIATVDELLALTLAALTR